jgi:hypothetical protein
MRSKGQMCNHFLVSMGADFIRMRCILNRVEFGSRKFVSLCALDSPIENEDISICFRLKHKNILKLGLFYVEDLPDLQAHRLPWPLG